MCRCVAGVKMYAWNKYTLAKASTVLEFSDNLRGDHEKMNYIRR
jgi:uncharacterized protein YkvS